MDDKEPLNSIELKGFRDRVGRVIKMLGGPRAASIVAGVTEDSLANWEKGRANPKFNNVVAFAKAANVSLDWLAYGNGDADPIRIMTGVPTVPKTTAPRENEVVFTSISRVDLPLYGGAINSGDTLKALGIEEAWVRRYFRTEAIHLSLITAVGDHMEPTIRTGDIVLFDTSVDRVTDSGIYVLDIDGTASIRRIQKRIDGEMLVKSDNQTYDDEPLNGSSGKKMKVFGLVRWVGKIL